MIPAAHTVVVVEEELRGACTWGERHSVQLEWLPKSLELRARFIQPGTKEGFFLRGTFDNYKAIAPAWTFGDHAGAPAGPEFFPLPVNTPHGNSIFITGKTGPVICVPFNRLAYAQQGGPHEDWGGPANWLNAGVGHVRADTIADMLQVIHRDFAHTRGRMRPS